jgi:hypothetical protein
VAAARFQVVTVVPRPGPPAMRRPIRGTASGRRRFTDEVSTRLFTWHFLAANNRRLAAAAKTFAHIQECMESIRALQEALPRAVVNLVQESPGRWLWWLRIDGTEQAVSHHGYPLRVRAQLACDSFLALVPGTKAMGKVRVVYR